MKPVRILIVNPNSSTSMTDALHEPIESLGYNNVVLPRQTPPPPFESLTESQTEYTYHTSPSGPPSIDDPSTAFASAHASLPSIIPLLPTHDAILIACYSPHPLIPLLKSRTSIPILGILEASVSTALSLLRNEDSEDPSRSGAGERFGVVSTAMSWEKPLHDYIADHVLGHVKAGEIFGGVETCGLAAGDLHSAPVEEVERRVKDATRRLLKTGEEGKKMGVVVLGCAGMAGMEAWVRDVAGEGVRVVDGVRAGVGMLQGLARGAF